jgi:hypothetical protein
MIGPRLELNALRAAALPAALAGATFFRPTRDLSTGEAAVRQTARIRIKATADAVYALLDPAAAHNRWVLRKEQLTPVGVTGRDFRLESPKAPGVSFLIEVKKAAAPFRIVQRCSSADGGVMGAARGSTSVYELKDADGACETTLTETTEFVVGLPPFLFGFHALLMRFSMRMDLLRLKYEAETGRDADERT